MDQFSSSNDFTINIEQTVSESVAEQQTPDDSFRENLDKLLQSKPEHPKLSKFASFFQESPAKVLDKSHQENQRFSVYIANLEPISEPKPLLVDLEDPKKIEKRVQIMQRLEAEKQLKDEQMRRNKEGNRLILQIKEKIKQKEQALKLKEWSLILPELEKRKQVLAQKRELSQPIRLDILTEHQRKYDDEMKIKRLEKEAEKIEFDMELKQKSHQFPKSQAQLRLEEEQRHLKIQQQLDFENKKLKRQRANQYADAIKDILFKEVQQKRSPPNISTLPAISSQIKKLIPEEGNVTKIENAIGRRVRHKSQYSRDTKELRSYREAVWRPPRDKPQDVSPSKPNTTDYLQQMKDQRQHQSSFQAKWDKIITDDENPIQRYQNVLNMVQLMQEKAKERAIIAIAKNDVDEEDKANQLYIRTIKAKLALLDN